MKYYYVKDGILNSHKGEYIVIFTLLSSDDTAEFSQITIDRCVMNVNKKGQSSIEIDWHNKTDKHHQVIFEKSGDAVVLKSSSPIYAVREWWSSFLPCGRWPIILESEYAIETRD